MLTTRRRVQRPIGMLLCLSVCVLTACAAQRPATPTPAHPAATTPTTGIQQARLAYHAGRYIEALRLLEPLAKVGNPDAEYTLGYLYYYGYGTNKDKDKALYWIRRAAEQGNDRALAALQTLQLPTTPGLDSASTANPMATATTAFKRGDYRTARAQWLRLATEGDCRAQIALARMHELGIGVPTDFTQADRWYALALKQECPGIDAIIRLVRPPTKAATTNPHGEPPR
ncbi:MAG: tetratricopeptide repeat protein [Gammaproteobacteria bacterium]